MCLLKQNENSGGHFGGGQRVFSPKKVYPSVMRLFVKGRTAVRPYSRFFQKLECHLIADPLETYCFID
jgi:hypothetical protein